MLNILKRTTFTCPNTVRKWSRHMCRRIALINVNGDFFKAGFQHSVITRVIAQSLESKNEAFYGFMREIKAGQWAPIGHHHRCVSPAANATQLYQRDSSLVILYLPGFRLLKRDSRRCEIYKSPFSSAHFNHALAIFCKSPASSGLVGSSPVMACKAQNQ